jgi:hypothetical protein
MDNNQRGKRKWYSNTQSWGLFSFVEQTTKTGAIKPYSNFILCTTIEGVLSLNPPFCPITDNQTKPIYSTITLPNNRESNKTNI